ncbi:MAG: molybdopterin-dependent oxidoreductase [Acidobacteria bacterium]|nr:molybdopterin-dependent oxidoreductase [Acidobacteriota bacterium]
MKHIDLTSHVTGTSQYVDDIPLAEGTLHAAVFGSPVAHGRLNQLQLAKALAYPGVAAILTSTDVPGDNQIGGIIPDEPLLAESDLHFMGQPIALVLADSDFAAREARSLIEVAIEELEPVVRPREAYAKGLIIGRERTFSMGDPDSAFAAAAHVFEGCGSCGGQEHLYIETQGAYAFPTESGHLRIVSSTQGPTAVQRTVARVLGIPMHNIEVDVRRLGGGFGGKEDQATPWAVMAALAAQVLNRPIKLVLHRLDDMAMTGKRHPYEFDYRIGLDDAFKIVAYDVQFYQDAGAAADLSPAVLERTLFHFTNTYFVPHARARAASCRTNVTPHTAFRGFGGPQGMFAIECAIAHAADELGVTPKTIQAANLLAEGDTFPYGQVAEHARAKACWAALAEHAKLQELEASVRSYNQDHVLSKRGIALMPICFGISFTKTHMNQAGALVHVYQDGSVSISTGAVEMGQGVSTKMVQVAAREFGIPASSVRIETTNTTRVANTSPSAASASADLNGKALQRACAKVAGRMMDVAASILKCERSLLRTQGNCVLRDNQPTGLNFHDLASACYLQRVNLSAFSHYATPGVHFDANQEQGHPFAYHVYGCAAVMATVDGLRGTYEFDLVYIAHDFGSSINPDVDLGQAEGGLVQGLGWMTCEELYYDDRGRLRSNALSTYKVPDVYAAPKEIIVDFLDLPGSPAAIYQSKAIGEPPLMYGIGGFFAIREALKAFGAYLPFVAPVTHERVLMAVAQKVPFGKHAGACE